MSKTQTRNRQHALLCISSCQAFLLRQHVASNMLPESFTTLVYSSRKSFMSFQQLYIIFGKGHYLLRTYACRL